MLTAPQVSTSQSLVATLEDFVYRIHNLNFKQKAQQRYKE